MTKEKSLLDFLREYMLLGEIAYIEQNAPVSFYAFVKNVSFYRYFDNILFRLCQYCRPF